MRQRTYSRGGNGRNGARRYQSRARELQARRTRSSARRGLTSARRARRAASSGQPARGSMRGNLLPRCARRAFPPVYPPPMTLAGRHTATSAGAHPLARYRGEFPIFRDGIYLNTCSLGALGERARRRVAQFLDVWQARGASAWYDVWWEALGELRTRYARWPGSTLISPWGRFRWTCGPQAWTF